MGEPHHPTQSASLARHTHPPPPKASSVTNRDETVVIPRQRGPIDAPVSSALDRWVAPKTIGAAPVGGSLEQRSKALATLSWVSATIIMMAVGYIRASWPGLSSDELAVRAVAMGPWANLRELFGQLDSIDLPYTVVMWAWTHVAGLSEFALRTPSVLAMAAAVGLTAALGARLHSPRVGIVSGLLMVAIPSISRMAQEATPNALTVLAATLTTYTLVVLFDRPGPLRFIWYGLAVAALGMCCPVALALLGAHLFVVMVMRPRIMLGWVVAMSLGAAPAVTLLVLGHPTWRHHHWVTIDSLLRTDLLVAGVFGGVMIGSLVLGLSLLGVAITKPTIVASAWAVIPVLLLAIATRFAPLELPQYAAITLPAWALLAGLALATDNTVRGLLAFAVVALAGLGAQVDFRASDGHGQATRDLAGIISTNFQQNDAVVYGPTLTDGLIGRDIVARYVPSDRRPQDALLTRAPRSGGEILPTECPAVLTCLKAAPRVWLVRADPAANLLDGFPAAKDGVLRADYAVARNWKFKGLTLALLTLRPPNADRTAK